MSDHLPSGEVRNVEFGVDRSIGCRDSAPSRDTTKVLWWATPQPGLGRELLEGGADKVCRVG